MSNNVDWYDYSKLKPVGKPSGECEVYIRARWQKAFVVGVDLNGCIVFQVATGYNAYRGDQIADFRPLDWNKNQKKPVDLSWLVGSGIDCEFSDDDDEGWRVGNLEAIKKCDFPYKRLNGDHWKHCRPRMNHPMVLTQEQVDLIPDVFVTINHTPCNIHDVDCCIIEFIDLVVGYCWPWEANNA